MAVVVKVMTSSISTCARPVGSKGDDITASYHKVTSYSPTTSSATGTKHTRPEEGPPALLVAGKRVAGALKFEPTWLLLLAVSSGTAVRVNWQTKAMTSSSQPSASVPERVKFMMVAFPFSLPPPEEVVLPLESGRA